LYLYEKAVSAFVGWAPRLYERGSNPQGLSQRDVEWNYNGM